MRLRLQIAKTVRTASIFGLVVGMLTGLSSGLVFAIGEGQIEGGDIYRIKNVTKNSGFASVQTADPCETVQYKIRLHNPGPGVVGNVNVRASLPSTVSATHTSTATISGSNMQPATTTAQATLNLSSAKKLNYIAGSTELLNTNSGVISSLPDGVIGSGVNIGSVGVSLNEIRFVVFQAKVDCDTPPPPVSDGACTGLAVQVVSQQGRQVTATVSGSVTNAEIVGYVINWGDGTTSATQTANHTYAQAGTYTVTATVKVKLANGTVVDKSSEVCKKTIVIETPPPPPADYKCTLLEVTKQTGRVLKVTKFETTTANGATFKNAVINWGDGSANTTTATPVGQTHEYQADGTYVVKATAFFTLANGQEVSHASEACTKTVVYETPPPPVSDGKCSLLNLTGVDSNKREVRAVLTGSVDNAQIVGYQIDWGDGAKSTDQTATHAYSKDGSYMIVGTVRVKLANGTEVDKTSDDCKKTIKFEKSVIYCPVAGKENLPIDSPDCKTVITEKVTYYNSTNTYTPTTQVVSSGVMPDTGPGSMAAVFVIVSVASGVGYYVFASRRYY